MDLDRAGAFLADLDAFSFRAVIRFDVMQPDGAMLEFGALHDVSVRRPDRLRFASVDRDGSRRSLVFDGRTISIELPDHGAYVSVERPGTLYAALDHLIDELDVRAPLEDLLGEDFAKRVRSRIESAYFVDRVQVGERICDHLLYRLPEVDVQLFVENGERPLLCRIVITHLREPGHPQFAATFEEWVLEPELPDSLFEFEPPAGARRLPIRGPEPAQEAAR